MTDAPEPFDIKGILHEAIEKAATLKEFMDTLVKHIEGSIERRQSEPTGSTGFFVMWGDEAIYIEPVHSGTLGPTSAEAVAKLIDLRDVIKGWPL